MKKSSESRKHVQKVERELARMCAQGLLICIGEREGQPLYKPTKAGLAIARKRLKGFGGVGNAFF